MKRFNLLLVVMLVLSVLLPGNLNAASPNDNDLKSNRPSLPEWLLPRGFSPEQYEANPFSPKLYRFWKGNDVLETQQKLEQLIRSEHLMGVRQQIRSKYAQASKIARNCSIAKCSP